MHWVTRITHPLLPLQVYNTSLRKLASYAFFTQNVYLEFYNMIFNKTVFPSNISVPLKTLLKYPGRPPIKSNSQHYSRMTGANQMPHWIPVRGSIQQPFRHTGGKSRVLYCSTEKATLKPLQSGRRRKERGEWISQLTNGDGALHHPVLVGSQRTSYATEVLPFLTFTNRSVYNIRRIPCLFYTVSQSLTLLNSSAVQCCCCLLQIRLLSIETNAYLFPAVGISHT